jgi:hypothetical protein
MNKNTLILAVILVFILVISLFMLDRIFKKRKAEMKASLVVMENTLKNAKDASLALKKPVIKEVVVERKTAPVVTVIAQEEHTKADPVFLGNMGYVLKEGKTTYIRSSLFEEIRNNSYYGILEE